MVDSNSTLSIICIVDKGISGITNNNIVPRYAIYLIFSSGIVPIYPNGVIVKGIIDDAHRLIKTVWLSLESLSRDVVKQIIIDACIS